MKKAGTLFSAPANDPLPPVQAERNSLVDTYDPTETRLQLFRNGYFPIPSKDKKCRLTGWPRFRSAISEASIPTWRRRHYGYNATGLLVCDGLMPLDFDVQDEAAMAHVMAALERIAPDVYDYGPRRTGSAPKLMVFARWQKSTKFPDMFACDDTRKFRDTSGLTHRIEVFGGRPSSTHGGASRQVGVYGPHSFFEDENENIIKPERIKRLYTWADADDAPTLLNTPLHELPAMTEEQVIELLTEFDTYAAQQPGWVVVAEKSKKAERFKYDITPETLFEPQYGDALLSYADLGEDMRLSASFVDGLTHNRKDRCHTLLYKKLGVIGIYDHDTATLHLPESEKPAGSNEELSERLRASLGDQAPRPGGPQRPAKPGTRLEEQAEWLLRTHAYSALDYTVIDLFEPSDRCQMAPKAFQMLYRPWREVVEGPNGGKHIISAAGAWEVCPMRINVAGVRMRPDHGFPIYLEHGALFKNTYLRPQHVGEGEIETFLAFMEHLLPDPIERGWFLDWIAHKQRRPDIPGVSVIMVAAGRDGPVYGAGRGMLRDVLARLFGHRYVRAIDFDVFSGRSAQGVYTDWAAYATLVTVSESKDMVDSGKWSAQRAVYERLKEVVDPRPVLRTFIRKGLPAFEAPAFASYLIFSNNFDALQIPADDRRVTALANGDRLPAEQAQALQEWMDTSGNIATLARWLEARDLTAFDIFTPLHTRTKAVMQDMSRSDLDIALADIRQTTGYNALFTRHQIQVALEERLDGIRRKLQGDGAGPGAPGKLRGTCYIFAFCTPGVRRRQAFEGLLLAWLYRSRGKKQSRGGQNTGKHPKLATL